MWHDGLGGGRAVRVPSRVVVEWWTDILGPTPNALLADGHRVLNAGWYPTYYVVGPTGRIRPDMRSAYATWSPHRFLGFLALFGTPGVPPNQYVVRDREPKLLGSELHVWNDDQPARRRTRSRPASFRGCACSRRRRGAPARSRRPMTGSRV